MIPSILLHINARLRFGHRAGRPRAATARQPEAALVQHIERLLDEAVLEEKPRRIPIGTAVIRIATLIQRIRKHIATQRHPAAHQNARQLPELHIGQAVLAKLKAAPIPQRYAAGPVRIAHRLHVAQHAAQREMRRFGAQPRRLAKPIRQRDGAVAQEVEHVAEQHAVAIDKVAALCVARDQRSRIIRARRGGVRIGEHGVQFRVGIGEQRLTAGRIMNAADVQFDDAAGRRRGFGNVGHVGAVAATGNGGGVFCGVREVRFVWVVVGLWVGCCC